MIENELKPAAVFDDETGAFERVDRFDHRMDINIHGDTSGNKFHLYSTRTLETSLDEETVGRKIHSDEASSLELKVYAEMLKSEPSQFERGPLTNSTYGIEPEIHSLERERPDSRIYYELDLDTGAMFEWRDSSGNSLSAADRRKFGGQSFRLTDSEIGSDCLVCYENKATVSRRKCCKFPVCHTCLEAYYTSKVSMATVIVQCIGYGCNKYVCQAEIMSYLPVDLQTRFMQLLVDAKCDPHLKTCPRCSHVTKVDAKTLVEHGDQKYGLRCSCSVCDLIWCFKCQAPWHESLSCQEYRRGDRQFKTWTKQQTEGQMNAQRCPKCDVFIQRNGGCDHMTCARCSTDFCYQCGEKYQKIKFIGNHRSRYSILGCKYRYKPDSPVVRRLVRGSIFGGKLLAAPIVGGLALGAGAVVVGLGLAALPFYGGYKLHKLLKQKRKEKWEKARERSWTDFENVEVEDILYPDILDSSRYGHYFGRARSTTFSTFSDYHQFEFDDVDHFLTDCYGDGSDDYNMAIYSCTGVEDELEDSTNSPSPLQQSGYEASGEATGSVNMKAMDLDDTGALNSDYVELPADSNVLNGSYDGAYAKPVTNASSQVRIPGHCIQTYVITSTKLGMNNKTTGSNQNGGLNLNSSLDAAEPTGCDEVVETCDAVTHF